MNEAIYNMQTQKLFFYHSNTDGFLRQWADSIPISGPAAEEIDLIAVDVPHFDDRKWSIKKVSPINGIEQIAILYDAPPTFEYADGWTVEYLGAKRAGIEFWVAALYDADISSIDAIHHIRGNVINFPMDTAMQFAIAFRDSDPNYHFEMDRTKPRVPCSVFVFHSGAMIRLRNQQTGDVICADIL